MRLSTSSFCSFPAAIFIIAIVVCLPGGSTHSQDRLTSPAWKEFITVAKQYDSLQVVFKKLETEHPEVKNNPYAFQALLKDDMTMIYRIYQALPEKAQAAAKELEPIAAYSLRDLRYVKLAAISANELPTALKATTRLLAFVKEPDSVAQLTVEAARFHSLLGQLDKAAELTARPAMASAKEMDKFQVYSTLASGYLDSGDTTKAQAFALQGVQSLCVLYAQSEDNFKKLENDKDYASQLANQRQYFIQQFTQAIAPVSAALKSVSEKRNQHFLTNVRDLARNDSLWSDISASVEGEVKKTLNEQAALNKPATEWSEHLWPNTTPQSLKELRGKVVLVDFFATWCQPCIMAFPHLKKWQETYAPKGLVIVGLTTYQGRYGGKKLPPEEEYSKLKDDFISKHGISWHIGIEKAGAQTFTDYGVQGIPRVALIDKAGNIRYIKVGAADFDKTERAIQKLLAE